MIKQYLVIRDVTPEECPWLLETVPAETIVYELARPDFGCCSPGGLPCTYSPEGGYPFFELPKSVLKPMEVQDGSEDPYCICGLCLTKRQYRRAEERKERKEIRGQAKYKWIYYFQARYGPQIIPAFYKRKKTLKLARERGLTPAGYTLWRRPFNGFGEAEQVPFEQEGD